MAVASEPVRCSDWARGVSLDPIGSIGSYRGYLLVDVPLPWPRDVSELPEVAELDELLVGRGVRVQAVVQQGSVRRVAGYLDTAGGDEPFVAYSRSVQVVAGDLREAVEAVLEGRSGPADGGVPRRSGTGETADGDGGADGNARTLLVCTHGRRDVCCGSKGTDLVQALGRSGAVPAGVELRRTSHTGGHRFAPTCIVLPEGTGWAFADPELVSTVLTRDGEVAAVADRYRGCAGLRSARVQALEREVLLRCGWGLLDRPRAGEEAGDTVRLHVTRPDRGVDVWEAEVVAGRSMPVPDCMQPLSAAKKRETQWAVGDVELR